MPLKETKVKPKSNLDFRLMSLTYKFRDFRLPRMNILKEVGNEIESRIISEGLYKLSAKDKRTCSFTRE